MESRVANKTETGWILPILIQVIEKGPVWKELSQFYLETLKLTGQAALQERISAFQRKCSEWSQNWAQRTVKEKGKGR